MRYVLSLIVLMFVFMGNAFAAGDMQPVSFTDTPDPLASNGEVVYTIEFKNNALDTAVNPELNVTVPDGFTYLSSDFSGCSYSGSVPSQGLAADIVRCTAATFPGSTSEDINIRLRAPTVTDPTVFESTATASCDDDINPANNEEIVKTTVVEGSDLVLTKTSSPNPATAGGIVTYKFDVVNKGPHTASSLSLTDTLPGGLTFVGDNASPAAYDDADWGCSASGQEVTCTGSDLAVGDTSTFYFRVKVSASSTEGDITNSATVASTTAEVKPDDNTNADLLVINSGTDMSIVKSITTIPAISGQDVAFTLDVTNNGPEPAEDVNITDILPAAGYTNVSAVGTGWTCDTNANPTITCTRDATPMAAGLTETITITAEAPTVNSIVVHQNSATVGTSTADPIAENDTDTVTYALNPDQADLSLTKTKSPTPLAVGDTATSVITVRNNGPRPATPVQVVDVLSDNETYVNYNGTDWSCTHSGANGDGTGGSVSCDYSPTLAVNATAPDLNILTEATYEGSLENRACTGGSEGSLAPDASDTNTANNCVSASVSATDPLGIGTADIIVTKTTDDDTIEVNENNFTYTINVKNREGNTSRDVEFRDTIPQYVSAFGGRPATTLTATTDKAGATCTITSALVVCQLGDMALNDEVNVTITVERPMADGSRTNTASAYSPITGDPNRSNNEDTATVNVLPVAEIELQSKIVTPSSVLAGTEATYTIQIRNNGPSIAKDVNITDVFTGELFTFLSASTSKGTCDSFDSGAQTLTCHIGDMNSGETQSVEVLIRPDHQVPAPANWEINNTATVTMSTLDSNPNNNEKNVTLVVTEGELDLAIEKSESPDFHEPVSFDPYNLPNNLIVYKVEIQNYGPSLATDVRFSDRMLSVSPDVDQNLTFLRDTGNADGTDDGTSVCTPQSTNPFTPDASAPTIDCNISELPSGGSYERYLVFHVENAPNLVTGDVYRDEINVTSRETDTLLGNNVEDERTTVRVTTDPQIVKTVSDSVVEVGQNFTYNLRVTNNGPGYSPETIVTDNLPAGMVLTGTPTISPLQGSCTGVAGDASFTCRVDSSDGTLHSQYGDAGGISEVNITVPVMVANWTQDVLNNFANVTTTGPDSNSSNNESNVTITVLEPAHIGDRVWLDRDANGIQSHNWRDRNIPNIPVYLIDTLGNIVQRTTTDSNGIYGFDINHSADYRVEFNITGTNYQISPQEAGSDRENDSDINASASTEYFTVHYGDNNLTIDAGLYTLVSLGDRVWIDENGNGIQDSGEANVPDVNVTLYKEGNITAQASMLTDSNGRYLFENLIPGRYYVVFDKTTLPPGGYVFTTRNAGSNNNSDSDADRNTGESEHRSLYSSSTPGNISTYRDLDAGIYIPVSIGDRVWYDINGDGIQDSGEANLSNVPVRLFRASDLVNPVTSDLNGTAFPLVTDANGSYLFDNLRPDTYVVKFLPGPNGNVLTLQNQGGDAAIDSDPDASTGFTGNYILNSGDEDLTVDAGYYIPIRVGDRVWEDRDYNGLQDNGELNVSGVTVTLVIDGATGTETRVTDGNGEYLFDDLAPGHRYSVEFSLPAGYQFTQQDVNSNGDDTVDSDVNASTGRASGETPLVISNDENLTFDAGIYRPLTIGNYVWEDLDADGVQDGGEPGIDGVVVELYIDDNPSGTTTTTSGGGFYQFTDLLPNHTYTVAFISTPSAEYKITTRDAVSANDGTDSDLVSLGTAIAGTPLMYSGEQNLTLDAGFYRNASLGNRVWIDANGNGIQDGGESSVPGVSVELFNVAGTSQGTLTTDANGLYHFDNLRPGSYYVEFTDLPAGYVFTQQNKGGNNALDSDVNSTTGRSDIVTLISNQDDNTTDAGIYIPVEVGDRIWLDTNANGIQDNGEGNYAGSITVTIVDNNDATNTSTVTTNNGDYNIANLRPGNYHLEFTLPAGYNVSPKDATADSSDSDVDTSTLRTDTFDLVSAANQYTWDMGIYQNASIGDRVWIDSNADGIQNMGETGLDGVTVELYKDGVATGITTTTATVGGISGIYEFADLVPGNYSVHFTPTATYVISPQDVTDNGTDDTNDSDVNATTFLTQTTTLVSGENDPTWDAGMYVPASIGDRIWLDANGNGIQDAGEGNYNLGTVTVHLEDENNASVTDINGNAVAAVSTNTGTYTFTNLVPGTYHVRFEFPADAQISPLNTGAPGTDSDVRLDTNTTVNTVLVSGENDTTWDAGVFLHAGLGDTIWIDTNGNGIQDDAEVLDINVTVNLYYDGNNSLVDTQTIAAGSDGNYSFIDVDPDNYYVKFVLPVASGYQFIAANAGSDDTVDSDVDAAGRTPTETISSGEFNTTLDAGIYIPASLGDRVWLDADANGIQDSGENNVSDINVTLYDNTGAVAATTVTDENGTYAFTGLVPGDYTVAFALTDNNGLDYTVTPQVGVQNDANNSDVNATGGSSIITLVSGKNNLNIDAGLYVPVSIGDFVWSDADGNGIQNMGEMGIQDVNVTLFKEESNGTVTTIGSQDTNATGGYLFTDLVPGNYYVHFEQPDHFRPTAQNSGTNDAIDSDADIVSGNTAHFELFSPDDNLTLDAGFYRLATISGHVSEDINNDDIGDVNLQFVDMALVDSSGITVATTQTDSNGSYIFIDVEPGTYTVVETQPAGLASVSENEGGADNDPGNSTLDNIISVTVGIGENDVNNDFVEEAGVTIGDRVWNDANGDGIQDPSETNTTGLDGIVVNLYNIQDVLIASTTTDFNGEYLFVDYPEDTYYVGFDLTTLPAHFGVTQQDQGSDDTNDSDALIATGITGSDYLAPGEDNRTFDMGIYLLGTISGTVLEDLNSDGTGDRPMAGVEIVLYDENGKEVARTRTDANGRYIFTDLPQGVYTIKETQPSGYLDVGEADGDYQNDGSLNSISIDLSPGEHDADNDYIEEIGGSIGNYVWHDTNGDGLQDPDEAGVNAVHVCLEDDQGNAILDASGTQRCTDTNASGYYLFEGVIPGDYVLVFEIPAGTTLTPFPQEGSNEAVDSDPLEVIGGFASAAVTMGLGEDILTIDMGLVYLNDASIGDFVWIDENRNGIFDPSEAGLDGVTVNLYDVAGKLVETIVTHDGGKYLFEHLAEGIYVLEFVVPNALGYEFTQSSIGTNDRDSDANTATGKTEAIELREGEHIVVIDAGVYCGCEDAPIKANGGDALGLLGMLAMMLMTLMMALFFVRKEEEQRV